MDWSLYWTWVAQLLILSTLVPVVCFLVGLGITYINFARKKPFRDIVILHGERNDD